MCIQFAGTPADCASLGISGKLFVATIPDLVTLLLDPNCLIMLYVTKYFTPTEATIMHLMLFSKQ